jgi:pimeloyl-ACP methyl ester carboxylesterase
MINEEGGRIDYNESGSGPTVIFVPGSCSTGAAWRPVMSHLGNGFRCVTTSLLGYGQSTERRTARDADISHEVELLKKVIRHTGRPVHLVGHSFGGLTALSVALGHDMPLLSLAVLEAPAPEILAHTEEFGHYRAFQEMTNAYFAAFHAGESTAIKSMIDFYGGAGTFDSWPERVRAYAVETTATNILDWASACGFHLTRAWLATVDIPTLVLWGGTSHPAIQRANELIGQNIPNARITAVEGAAHFMVATHASQVAAVLTDHLAHAERVSGSALSTP